MSLFQDLISDDDVKRIGAVMDYPEHHFDLLARIAGLEPSCDFRHSNLRFVDFRGADLRGFDFTGSDLRYCVKDTTTVIDDTTIFADAVQDWIAAEEVPIVQIMLEARAASNSHTRRRLLGELVANHNSSNHINKFLFQLIESSGRIEIALDFADHLIGEVPDYMLDRIANQLAKLIEKRLAETTRRARNVPAAKVSAEQILQCIEESRSDAMRVILHRVAAFAESMTTRQHESFKDTLELSLGELARAVGYTGNGLTR
jgi:Pentapeptide repeats (8 copies)